jgi:hypothetical protein
MTDYENDPRVTRVGDDDYQVDTEGRWWRIYRDGDRWFSQAPPGTSPFVLHDVTFEHPSKTEAFKVLLAPCGGMAVVTSARIAAAGLSVGRWMVNPPAASLRPYEYVYRCPKCGGVAVARRSSRCFGTESAFHYEEWMDMIDSTSDFAVTPGLVIE